MQRLLQECIKKQSQYLYPKILKALNNELRRRILDLLVQDPEKRWSFSEIKAAFPKQKKAAIANHLQTLQMADLVERTVKLEERYVNSDPYYCFYSVTPLGKHIIQSFWRDVEEGLRLAVCP